MKTLVSRFLIEDGLLLGSACDSPQAPQQTLRSGPSPASGPKRTRQLPTAPPLRQLGASEFRLTIRDGDRRPFCFSPDGKLIAAANWDEVKLWTFPEGKLLHDFSDVVDSNCIAFSEDGSQLLAFSQRDDTIYRFDVPTGKLASKAPVIGLVDDVGATSFSISADGRWLASTEVYSHTMAWDTKTGQRQFREKLMRSHGRPVSKSGVLTLWDSSFVDQIDVTTGKRLARYKQYQMRLSPISSPDGTLMAGYSKEDQAIVFWNTASNELVGGKIPADEREWLSNQGAISADGKRFVYWVPTDRWIFNRRMAVYDVATGEKISEFDPPDAYFLDDPIISPDGRYVFPSGNRAVFTPIDVETGTPVYDQPDHILPIEALDFTPDGSKLIVGGGDKRQVWDVATGEAGAILENWYHRSFVAAVDDHRAIVSGLRDGGVRLQNIDSGAIERQYDVGKDRHLSSFQIGPDRKTFTAQSDGIVRRWDIETGATLASWQMPAAARGRELSAFGNYPFNCLVLAGTRLYQLDRVAPPKKLPDGSIDVGKVDLLLEDWTTQEVTNRLPLPADSQFNVAATTGNQTLAAVMSDDWYVNEPGKPGRGYTYLVIWDAATGREQLKVKRKRPDYHSAFAGAATTRDARLAATASHRNRIELWDGRTGDLIQRFDAPNDVTLLKFSEDGALLASGHRDGRVLIWNTQPARDAAVSGITPPQN